MGKQLKQLKATDLLNVEVPQISLQAALTPEQLRVRVQVLVRGIETLYLELAKRLYEIKTGRFYFDWGYDSWATYCDAELGISVRKADYLVQVWETVVLYPELEEVYKTLTWTRAKELARLARLDGRASSLKKWIEISQTKSVRELEKFVKDVARKRREKLIKNLTNKGNTADDIETLQDVEYEVINEGVGMPENKELYQMTFVLYEDAYRVVLEALDLAKRLTSSESRSFNLHTIALEFLSAHGELKGKDKANLIRDYFERLENELGLVIIAISSKTGEVVYGDKYLTQSDDAKKTTT